MVNLKKGIAVVGSTTIDRIVGHQHDVTKIGGVTAYAGITYSRHGIATRIVSNIARIDRLIIDRLIKEGIIVLNGPSDRTTHFINDVSQGTRRQKIVDRARSIQLHQLTAVVGRVGGLHLGPLHSDDIESEALTALAATDVRIFLDVQGYTRKIVSSEVVAYVSKHLTSALKAAHIIKASGAELKLIVDHYQKNLTEIMKSFDIEESVITLGQEGGWVQSMRDGRINFCANPVESVMDPTGAGDVFFAAYLIGRLLNNQNIAEACRYAALTAARQVAGKYITSDSLGLP